MFIDDLIFLIWENVNHFYNDNYELICKIVNNCYNIQSENSSKNYIGQGCIFCLAAYMIGEDF